MPYQKNVLITGCSSGIGRATAIHLAQHGFLVFATVRKEADAESLRALALPDLIPVCPLDLNHLEQIPEVFETVRAESSRRGIHGLYALINNAGGSSVAPIELMNLEHFRSELQVRVLGSVAMVQAGLPLLRQGRGRILWIMTPAAIPTPYVTSIHACDFAVNCLSRTLEIELKRWRIPNVQIRCGGIKTATGLRTMEAIDASIKNWSPLQAGLYADTLRGWGQSMLEFDEKRTEPEQVAGLILRALQAAHPKHRYSIGYMSGAAALLESLPHPWTDAILKTRF